jgi:probable F420-dependent oxidoreductase
MLIGCNIPTSGPLAAPETMVRLSTEAEALGYGYLTFSDHIVIPREIDAKYPYSETGEFPGRGRAYWQEQLTAIAFIAAKTSKVRFLTSVMVVPYRPALLTAKILSTIDVLSGGRLMVGIGAGWMVEEFEAVGAPPFAERGAVTDEYLRAFVELWTKDNPRFEGRFVKFADMVFEPKPPQKPHPPIWVGGESGPALRRAARIGDGWYPIGGNPAHPYDTLKRLSSGIEKVKGLAREAGRDPSSIAIGFRVQRHGELPNAKATDGERKLFHGSNAEIVEDLKALRQIGLSGVDFTLTGTDAAASIDTMKRFRDEVLAKI